LSDKFFIAPNVRAWRCGGVLCSVCPGAAADKRYKSSLFILLLGIIRLAKPKLNSGQKAENIFVAPPYCQCNVIRSDILMQSFYFLDISLIDSINHPFINFS
jgi:hypothetical protein